jgi:hypothetical protein
MPVYLLKIFRLFQVSNTLRHSKNFMRTDTLILHHLSILNSRAIFLYSIFNIAEVLWVPERFSQVLFNGFLVTIYWTSFQHICASTCGRRKHAWLTFFSMLLYNSYPFHSLSSFNKYHPLYFTVSDFSYLFSALPISSLFPFLYFMVCIYFVLLFWLFFQGFMLYPNN